VGAEHGLSSVQVFLGRVFVFSETGVDVIFRQLEGLISPVLKVKVLNDLGVHWVLLNHVVDFRSIEVPILV